MSLQLDTLAAPAPPGPELDFEAADVPIIPYVNIGITERAC